MIKERELRPKLAELELPGLTKEQREKLRWSFPRLVPFLLDTFAVNRGKVVFNSNNLRLSETHYISPANHLASILNLIMKGPIGPRRNLAAQTREICPSVLFRVASLIRSPGGLFDALDCMLSGQYGILKFQPPPVKEERMRVGDYVNFLESVPPPRIEEYLREKEERTSPRVLIVGVANVGSFADYLSNLCNLFNTKHFLGERAPKIDVADRSPVPPHLIRKALEHDIFSLVVERDILARCIPGLNLFTQEVGLNGGESWRRNRYSHIFCDIVSQYNLDKSGSPDPSFFGALLTLMRPGGLLVVRDFVPSVHIDTLVGYFGPLSEEELAVLLDSGIRNPALRLTELGGWMKELAEAIFGEEIKVSSEGERLGPRGEKLDLSIALHNPLLVEGLQLAALRLVEVEPANEDGQVNIMVTSVYQLEDQQPVLFEPVLVLNPVPCARTEQVFVP